MGKPQIFGKLQRVRLSDEVVEKIKESILKDQLRAGDRLPSEREMSQMFGVGRPTIREALSVLEYMGLIEINPGARGSTVKELDISLYLKVVREQLSSMITISNETIIHLYEVRQFLELGIALAVAEHATDQETESLDEYLQEMASYKDDIEMYFPVGIEFHRHLARLTHNNIYMILWEMIHDTILQAYTPILSDLYPQGPGELIDLNKQIVKAIKSKNKEKIRLASEAHGKKDLYIRKVIQRESRAQTDR